MLSTTTGVIIVLVVILLAIGMYFYAHKKAPTVPSEEPKITMLDKDGMPVPIKLTPVPAETRTYTSSTTLEIKVGETKTFEDLSITNTGRGGHKILTREDGGGDLSFAELTLMTPRETKTTYAYAPEGTKPKFIDFDLYHLEIQSMQWNGASVTLLVKKE